MMKDVNQISIDISSCLVIVCLLPIRFSNCSDRSERERDKEGIFAVAEALFHGAAGELLRSSYRRRERRHVGAHRRRRRQGAASDREEAAAPEEPADYVSG